MIGMHAVVSVASHTQVYVKRAARPVSCLCCPSNVAAADPMLAADIHQHKQSNITSTGTSSSTTTKASTPLLRQLQPHTTGCTPCDMLTPSDMLKLGSQQVSCPAPNSRVCFCCVVLCCAVLRSAGGILRHLAAPPWSVILLVQQHTCSRTDTWHEAPSHPSSAYHNAATCTDEAVRSSRAAAWHIIPLGRSGSDTYAAVV